MLPSVPATATPHQPRTAAVPGPAFVTLQFGRTQWTTTLRCEPLPFTVDLDVVANKLAAEGIAATGGVVVDRTPRTGLECWSRYTLHPGWDWLRHAQNELGWSFISQSLNYRRLPNLTYEDQVAESCGSLRAFTRHGIDHADALFAYPANRWTEEIQTDPVSGCFSYGRRYLSNTPNLRATTVTPWFAWTQSVSGGRCASAALPCATTTGTGGQTKARYSRPATIAANIAAAESDTWYSMQFYRFVRGRYQSNTFGWDCAAPNWRRHWTSNGELYCWRDFRVILAALVAARDAGVTVASPYDVAVAWGRALP